jgi:hypothetical protein
LLLFDLTRRNGLRSTRVRHAASSSIDDRWGLDDTLLPHSSSALALDMRPVDGLGVDTSINMQLEIWYAHHTRMPYWYTESPGFV